MLVSGPLRLRNVIRASGCIESPEAPILGLVDEQDCKQMVEIAVAAVVTNRRYLYGQYLRNDE